MLMLTLTAAHALTGHWQLVARHPELVLSNLRARRAGDDSAAAVKDIRGALTAAAR
jgi:hypothetical protein